MASFSINTKLSLAQPKVVSSVPQTNRNVLKAEGRITSEQQATSKSWTRSSAQVCRTFRFAAENPPFSDACWKMAMLLVCADCSSMFRSLLACSQLAQAGWLRLGQKGYRMTKSETTISCDLLATTDSPKKKRTQTRFGEHKAQARSGFFCDN